MTEAASPLAGPDPDVATRRAFWWADAEADDAPDAVLCLIQSSDRAEELERQWADGRNPLCFSATTLDHFVRDCYERATRSLKRRSASPNYSASSRPQSNDMTPTMDLSQGSSNPRTISLTRFRGSSPCSSTPGTPHRRNGTCPPVGRYRRGRRPCPDLFASFRSTEITTGDGSLESQASIIPQLYANYQSFREEIHPDWKTVNSAQYLTLLDVEHFLEAVPESVDAVVLDALTRLAMAERETIARISRNLPTVAVLSLVHDSMGGNGHIQYKRSSCLICM